MPGTPGNLDSAQEKALAELRKLLEDAGFIERLDDSTLLRFLRARKFDVQLAKEMFENCEKWRKDYGTDTILQDFHYDEKPLIAKFYPQYYHKTDKDGRPVYFEELGAVNLHEMNKVTSEEEDVEKLGLGIRICRSIQITCLFKSCWSPSGNFMYNYGFERYLHI